MRLRLRSRCAVIAYRIDDISGVLPEGSLITNLMRCTLMSRRCCLLSRNCVSNRRTIGIVFAGIFKGRSRPSAIRFLGYVRI